jgi:hypothetical protein
LGPLRYPTFVLADSTNTPAFTSIETTTTLRTSPAYLHHNHNISLVSAFFTMAPSKYLSFAFLAILPFTYAQTYSSCNPLTQSGCTPNPGVNPAVFSTDFTQSSTLPAGWGKQNQGSVTYDSNGANFILAQQGDSPTFVSNDYILFGSMEVVMKAASGQGIVSSLILLSDDLDELDWVSLLSFKNSLSIWNSNSFFVGIHRRKQCSSTIQLLWQRRYHDL